MQFNYHLSEQDCYKFIEHRTKFSRFGRISLNSQRYLLYAFFGILFSGDILNGTVGYILTVPLFLLFYFTGPGSLAKATVENFKKIAAEAGANELIGWRSLILSDSFISEQQEGLTQHTPYDKIFNIYNGPEYCYIYYDLQTAAVVPWSAFKDENEKKSFLETLKIKRPDLLRFETK